MNYRSVSTEAILKGMVRKDAAWKVISDLSRYPSLMNNVDKVIIHERSEDKGKSEWYCSLENAPLHWLEQDYFDSSNYEIRFESIDGDFDQISGSWKVEDFNGEGIRLDYSVDYHLGIPVIEEVVGDVFQEKMRKRIDSMMQSIKEELCRPKGIEERAYPRVVTGKYNNVYVNGMKMRLKIINISKQGMMFIAHTKMMPGEARFIIDGTIIEASLFPNAGLPNMSRAVFKREMRQDELDHLAHYLTTQNIRLDARKLVGKKTVIKSSEKDIPVHIVDISPGGMLIKHFDFREVLEEAFEIEGVSITPRKNNYDTVSKTLRIQYAKKLSETDFNEILAKLESSNARIVEMQIA
jgi:ribosome-associated toxin RatA of RatAB toxin-antitoxin module